jgi:hypothetical protein
MSYRSIIAIADKYELCDEVLDVIFKYIYRNKIKICIDTFTNPAFRKSWKRCIKKEHKYPSFWNRGWDACHPGRYIIIMTYRKSFFQERVKCLEDKLYNLDYINRGPIKYKTKVMNNGVVKDTEHVNELYVNESPKHKYLRTHYRRDMIELLDFKNKVEEAFLNKPYENFKKNMKIKEYLPLLMA